MSEFVRSVVRAALANSDGPADDALESEAYLFVERQLSRLPDFLRVPIGLVSHSIDGVALGVYRKPFTSLTLPQQRYVIAHARTSGLGPVRDAVRFYESLAIFVREGRASG
jgi:hypothetical protein